MYKNGYNIPLSLAVWLAFDDYDGLKEHNAISATSLLKSIRQIILISRIRSDPKVSTEIELMDLVPSSLGSAVHDSIEKAWTSPKVSQIMEQLGYSRKIAESIVINPNPEDLTEDSIPLYLEQRTTKEFEGFLVNGQYDFVIEGEVQDFKTTGVFNYMSGSNDEKYRLQGSIYRWLNPNIITSDAMSIHFLFTNWSKLNAKLEEYKGYPQQRIATKKFKLLSYQETENYIRNKLHNINKHLEHPEEFLPYCTSEELWQDKTVFKYYKNPEKTTRSTKNFDSLSDAENRLAKDGYVGIIKKQKGQAKACNYCAALPICSQAKELIREGVLVV